METVELSNVMMVLRYVVAHLDQREQDSIINEFSKMLQPLVEET